MQPAKDQSSSWNSPTPSDGDPKVPEFISPQTASSRYFFLNLDTAEVADPRFVVVCGGMEKTKSDYKIARSNFPYFGIELVADGDGQVVLGSHSFPLSTGVMFAYGPGIPHRIENRPPGQMRKYFIDLAGSEVERLLSDAGLLSERPILVGNVMELITLWHSIDREARENTPLSGKICELLIRIFVLKVQQRRIEGIDRIPESYKTYESIRSYIDANYTNLTSVHAIAAQCSVTPVYLARLFKKYSSTAAYQYLTQLRMNYAAELLAEENMKVKDVAFKMGFQDPYQFSRTFKRVFGVAPANFQIGNSRTTKDDLR